MFAGYNYVETAAPAPDANCSHCIYMDDRTWTSTCPELLLRSLKALENFSQQVGKEKI